MHGLCFQGSTYKKFVSFTIDGPQHEFDFAIEILCGLFDEIKLTSHDFNNEKGRIKAEIREKDRRSSLDFYFDSIVWKNSEVEKIVLGYCKTVDRVSVKKINEFRQKVLSAGNCFIYATGNISDKNLDALNKKSVSLIFLKAILALRIQLLLITISFIGKRKFGSKIIIGTIFR